MLARRIIPCLDVADGRVVKGVHFASLRDAGDPVAQAARYDAEGADELVFLDISASHESRETTLDMVSRVAETIFIPFTVGGGIRSVEDAGRALRAGADKIAVNTAAVRDPELVRRLSDSFGAQCVVAAVDVRQESRPRGPVSPLPRWATYITGGREATHLEALDWIERLEQLGAGEILLTSMDRDGTQAGYDLELLRAAADRVRIPVIASGGAGRLSDLADALEAGAHGVLAASIFHFEGCSLPEARAFLRQRGYPVRSIVLLRQALVVTAFLSSGGELLTSGTQVNTALRTAGPPDRRTATDCVRLQRAGTVVKGEVKICPGRYKIQDPQELGVIVAAASGTRIDLTGVTIQSGDSVPSRFVGIGISAERVDSVSVRGGRIRGFRYGIRIEGGSGHRITGVELSGSRSQMLRSTPERYDEADWLDIFQPDTFELYGSGLYLKRTRGAVVIGVTARGAQNGIGLFESREALLADNDVSGNSGWGIHLWSSSQNTIVRNQADHNVRCESPSYRHGCDSAALLLRARSDSNYVADNDLSWSGDGFFLSGQRGLVPASIGNVVVRNDASFAYHNAFESTFSEWNSFLENRADSSDYGFWLGYSRANLVQNNSVVGARTAGIAIEHGGENTISGNTIIGGQVGIKLFAPHLGEDASRDYRVDDNTIARVEQGIVLEHTSRSRLRGNRFDGVDDALVADAASDDVRLEGNIFLTVRHWFIDAPSLDAGGNFWAAVSADSVATQVRGKINLLPFRTAQEAGY